MTLVDLKADPVVEVEAPEDNYEINLDDISPTMLKQQIAEFVFTSKYARYLEDEKRRETWDEAVGRVENMHLTHYDWLDEEYKDEIRWAFDRVREKLLVPSMRSMQFGGPAVFAHNARIFNCAVRHVDSIRSFAEIFYLLLCGCGVGIGLMPKFLNRLPDLVTKKDKTGTIITYVIEDSIEGWADSVEALLNCYFVNTAYSGRKIVFDYSKIRPEGSPLKTGGGKAPGYKGLKAAHQRIKALLDDMIEVQKLSRMRSIDAYDTIMHTADAVLSGGVRRSATAIQFHKDDELMLNAKTGDWFKENPQRARSNNSVILLRDEVTKEEFDAILNRTKEWGEPGFVFADHPDTLFNPCYEIGFVPVTDDGVCGVQFCNLTSISGNMIKTVNDFVDATKAATIIGSLQAGYTEFPYLSNAAQQLTEEESLLGVSITAMMESPDITLDGVIQTQAARYAVEINKEWAAVLGINQAARITALKPEGTSSLARGTMSSGIHAAHSRLMWRRIQANKNERPAQFFKEFNPHLVEESVWSANGTDWIIKFPIINDADAIFKGDITALEHLEIIKNTQANWVLPGTTEANKKPLTHNVSCTVVTKDEEWDDVAHYLYNNRANFAAVSFISDDGDKKYAQAPNEAITNDVELQQFYADIAAFIPVDYRYMVEMEDGTKLAEELACAGTTGCELR